MNGRVRLKGPFKFAKTNIKSRIFATLKNHLQNTASSTSKSRERKQKTMKSNLIFAREEVPFKYRVNSLLLQAKVMQSNQ